jgi:hypothetical protein
MKESLGIFTLLGLLALPLSPSAGTLFTSPVVVVTPTTNYFGAASRHRSLTNTFLIENAGSGKLIGKATVESPFKIIDGGKYALRENEAQVVTIVYQPSGTRSATNVVQFTGGGGAKVTVIGRPLKVSPF